MSDQRERQQRTEVIAPEPSEALANLLGVEPPRRTLPPLWHWVHLLERWPHTALGPDGHPTAGVPAPPGPGRKRMFAGGRVRTRRPLRIGRPATRTTWVAQTIEKTGRSGPLTFVTVRTTVEQDGAVAVEEDGDIVYRTADSQLPTRPDLPDRPEDRTARPPTTDGPRLALAVDEAFLFRFSALTYNAHRIHYDLRWARQEGYADLVVHGPLQALAMAELARRTAGGPRTLSYRLVAPMTGPQTFDTTAAARADGGLSLRVTDARGRVTATATTAPSDHWTGTQTSHGRR